MVLLNRHEPWSSWKHTYWIGQFGAPSMACPMLFETKTMRVAVIMFPAIDRMTTHFIHAPAEEKR